VPKLSRAALLAALITACSAAPALADGKTGGTSAPGPGATTTTPVDDASLSGATDTTATGEQSGGVTLSVRGQVLLGRKVRFSGRVDRAREGQTISVQRRDSVGAWLEVTRATTDSEGAWSVKWKARSAGSFPVRAVVARDPGSAGAAADQASQALTLTVYEPTKASTFYDRITACGIRLKRTTLGVANKTLPCGTRVAFYYNGRSITVPVVDRGPYRRGFSWDLTEATASKLGFEGIGTVGSLVLGPGTAVR
jgi:rare lipoprotein A